jgi:Cysteine rich repeat
VSTTCADDIDEHCAAEKAQAHGNAGVLRCLADKMVDPAVTISDKCETQMSRCARDLARHPIEAVSDGADGLVQCCFIITAVAALIDAQ